MARPTFVGIGPPKSATTWLDTVLRQHPDIFLPLDRKEVFYFDRYFDRGQDWYLSLFEDAGRSRAIGEISTSYITDPEALRRMKEVLPDARLVCILRHPIDRLVSNYRMYRENGRTMDNLETALRSQPTLWENSAYATLLGNVLTHFDRSQIHVGVFEDIFSDNAACNAYLASLFAHIGVPSERFEPLASEEKVRKTYGKPKSVWLVKQAKSLRSALRRRDMEGLVSFLARLGINRDLFLTEEVAPEISEDLRRMLLSNFADDIRYVEAFLDRPLPAWHK
ncbi:MAG: sulfotransferase [Pseudomonadota bacterium]